MGEFACPDNAALADYASGRGTDVQRQQLLAHLATCPRCRAIASSLSDATKYSASPPESEVEAFVLAGSHIGCDIADGDLADAETMLHPSREDVESRFDFRLFESPREEHVLGHLGKYTILEVLGYGGMGVVFRAHDEQLLRVVALKAMSRDLASSPTARRRFIREARAAAAINHPNVVTIHAVEEQNGIPFLVMEFIRGESLRERLRHGPRLGIVDVLRISSQVASGLAAANAHGVIHRDIKPANIMLEEGLQRVKITDFGLARVAVDNIDLTSRDRGIGTPAYMSPEQVRGDEIDARSDLFALGCVMFTMLRGHSPFHGKSALEIARRVADEDPEPSVANANIPKFLSEIIERLLQKSPKKRYQSAGEVAELLRGQLAVINQTPTDKLNQVLQRMPAAAGHKRRTIAVVSLLALCALISVAGLTAQQLGWFTRRGEQQAAGVAPPASDQDPAVPPTPDVPAPADVTVAQDGDADCKTLTEALAKAGPGTRIHILDSGEYKEPIFIQSAAKHRGISIVGEGKTPPTISNPELSGDVLRIENTPGVVLRGLKLVQSTDRQHALTISGQAAGVTVDRVQMEGSSLKFSLVYLRDSVGEAEQPIIIRDSRIDSPSMGIVVEAKRTTEPVRHIQILNNRFRGIANHVQVNVAAENIRVSGNVFVSGNAFEAGTAFALGIVDAALAKDITVSNNSCLRCRLWLDLRQTPPEVAAVRVLNNLVLETKTARVPAKLPLTAFVEKWNIAGNHWEGEPSPEEGDFANFVTFHSNIAVASRDPSQPDFLKPVAALSRAPDTEHASAYVGAIPH